MDDIGKTIRTLALAYPGVAAITDRMTAGRLPQSIELPAIVYHVIDTLPYEYLTGTVELARARIQVDAYALAQEDANNLATQIRLALQKKRGYVGDQWIDDINVQTGQRYAYDRAQSGTDQYRYINSQDFFVHYQITVNNQVMIP